MDDISKIKLPDGSEVNIKDQEARDNFDILIGIKEPKNSA